MGQSLPTVFNRVIPYPTGEISHADHGPQTALLSPVLARFMLDGKAVNGTFYAKGANKPAYTAAAYKTWKQSFMRTREAQRRNNKARRMLRRVSPRLTDSREAAADGGYPCRRRYRTRRHGKHGPSGADRVRASGGGQLIGGGREHGRGRGAGDAGPRGGDRAARPRGRRRSGRHGHWKQPHVNGSPRVVRGAAEAGRSMMRASRRGEPEDVGR